MVVYYCVACKKEIPASLVDRKIRCPYCSCKALEKRQNRILNPIKAR
jgi:DNA-directed RNA polymerase subunit RPC12/RpoP